MATALVRPHPLSARGQTAQPFPVGYSLAEIARIFWPDENAQRFVVAFVGDVRVPRERWELVRPKEGALVRLGLTCFEGGGKNKGIFAMVAMIALSMVAGPAAAAMGFTGATATAVAAGITLVGALAIGAIFKPPMLDVGAVASNPQDAQAYSITGQANHATPYGPMLRVYGRHRIYPRLAAVPFTVAEGPHQFLYMLLDCGYGPLDVTELQIGDSPILSYRDVLYRVHPQWQAGDPLEYYRNDTSFETLGLVLATDVPEQRTSAADASGLVLDFVMARGLVSYGDRGERLSHSVSFDVHVRPVGSATWEAARTYPTYSSHSADVTVKLGQVLAFAPASIPGDDEHRPTPYFPAGTSAFRVQALEGYEPLVGHTIYFASQTRHEITAIVPRAEVTFDITIDPPLGRDFSGNFVQCPVLPPLPTDSLIVVNGRSPTPAQFSLTVDVPPGAWEVRVIRRSPESTSDRVFDELTWTTLRSIADRPPVAVQAPHTLIELKIRASEQLSGVLQDVNCVATSILPVFDGVNWTEQPTRNPAWAYADVLRGPGAIRPLPLARIDAEGLKAWADYCDTLVANGVGGEPEPRVYFDHVVDYSTTTYQLLQSIAAAGRATPALRDGKHGVIVDEEQATPVQMFTPRNSWGFNSRRSYLNEPDALRVKFIDPASNWLEGHIVLYADGKDATNALTFEDLKLFGVTRYTQATRDGRYMKAQALLRREEFAINCDIENLIATRGDLVLVAHDVLEAGGESARITAIAGDVITLSDPFGTLAPAAYGARIRLDDGTITAPIPVTPIAPDQLQLSAVPVPAPKVGDLVAWGFLQTETGEYIVKQIAPGDDLTAQLTLAEIARDVYDADLGAIPVYVPPAGGRPSAGPGPAVLHLRVEQIDVTIAREPYCDLVLAWDAPELGGYPLYRIFQINDAGVSTQIAETHLTQLELARGLRLLDPAVTSTARTYGVIGIDTIKRQSAEALVSFTPKNPFHVPDDVLHLSSNVHDKTTTLTWFAPIDAAAPGNAQVLVYEVRWQRPDIDPVWGTAALITKLIPWNVTTVTVPSRNGAYLVKAITSSQVESLAPGITVTSVESLVIQDMWNALRFQPAWAGHFKDCEIVAGQLELSPLPDGTYPATGTYFAAPDQVFTEELQCRLSTVIDATGFDNTETMDLWIPLAIAAPLSALRKGVDYDVSVWVAAYDAAGRFPMSEWIPLAIADPLDEAPPIEDGGSTWRPLIHGEYIGTVFRFAVLLESFVPTVTPRVSLAGVDIDFPERGEEHTDIVVPATGLSFTFSRPFVFAPSVAVDLQSAAAGDYVDRGAVDQAGFPLFVRNSAGVAKAGVVDISVLGVGRTF